MYADGTNWLFAHVTTYPLPASLCLQLKFLGGFILGIPVFVFRSYFQVGPWGGCIFFLHFSPGRPGLKLLQLGLQQQYFHWVRNGLGMD